MDEALEPDVLADVQKVLDSFVDQHGDTDTIRFDHLHTRKAGQRSFVDVHMHMPASWTLGEAAALRGSVERALIGAVPGLRATIQLLPSDVEAHFNDTLDLK
jgi:divalent metal cation (Fe/Co/Zn/Cd) transporter